MAPMLPPPKPLARNTVAKGIPIAEIKYKKPEWSGKGSRGWGRFEVVKGGSLVDILKISKEYHIIGRDTRCDTVIEHPSSSRQHAVFQLSRNDDIYVYDCDSAHGTFVNKKQIKSKTHIKLNSGDSVVFGNSTRCFVLDIPSEEEPKVIVTESMSSELELFNTNKESIKDLLLTKQSTTTSSNTNTVNIIKDDRIEDVIGFDEDDEFYDRTVKKSKSTKNKKITSNTLKKDISRLESEQITSSKERQELLNDITSATNLVEQYADDPHQSYMAQASLSTSRDQLKLLDSRIKQTASELQSKMVTLQSVLPVLPELKKPTSHSEEKKGQITPGEIQMIKRPKKENQQPKINNVDTEQLLKAREEELKSRREEKETRKQSAMSILKDIQSDMGLIRQKKSNSERASESSTPATDDINLVPSNNDNIDCSDKSDNSTWVQPTGQTGDGRSALNDLLGY